MRYARRVFPLLFILLILPACFCPLYASFPRLPVPSLPAVGTLDVDISYDDDFYVETFNYSRDAPNIHHYVLVMPESAGADVDPGLVFVRYARRFEEPGDDEIAWTFDYIHDAPEGRFTGTFEPGRYRVAAAFLANALSREEAGVGDDVILYPGITGGGANTDFQTVDIQAGETSSLTFYMDDSNGWACPWLYVFDGQTFERRTEILRNLRGKDREGSETTSLSTVTVVDGAVVVRIAEEKDETSYLDSLMLVIDGETIPAAGMPSLAAADGDYLILRRGESVELRFPVPTMAEGNLSASVVATGYYTVME